MLLLHLTCAFLVLVFVGVEHAWPPWLQIGWTSPQLGLVAVLSIGLVSGPTAGAVAGALYAHDGIRRTSLPMVDAPAAQASLPRSRKQKQ